MIKLCQNVQHSSTGTSVSVVRSQLSDFVDPRYGLMPSYMCSYAVKPVMLPVIMSEKEKRNVITSKF